MIAFASSTVPGFSITTPSLASYGPTDQGLRVWFDNPQFLVGSDPCAYQLYVHAQTSNGWITNLHWDFGDGSTLDVPFSAQSVVSDARTHIYAGSGPYAVTVTAYDSAGDTGNAGRILTNVMPGSCDAPIVSNAVVQGTSLQENSPSRRYWPLTDSIVYATAQSRAAKVVGGTRSSEVWRILYSSLRLNWRVVVPEVEEARGAESKSPLLR